MANSLENCPVCGKIIKSGNYLLNHFSCTCGSLFLKNFEGELQNCSSHAINEFSEVLQAGTEGIWQDKKFLILGRYRLWFEESTYNYWSVQFADGSIKILGEGYGLYAIYELFDSNSILSIGTLDTFVFDTSIHVDGLGSCYFIRKNVCRHWDGEGDFYKSPTGIQVTFDAISNEGAIIEVFQYADKRIEVYRVHYCEVEELALSHLRAPEKKSKKFICDSCAGEIVIDSYPYSQSWSCKTCATEYYMFNGREISVGNDTKNNNLFDCYLEIGSSIILGNYTFKVLGFLVKKEVQFDSYWTEYVVHHPLKGYRFLNESDGHWMVVKEMGNSPSMNSPHYTVFAYNDQEFSIFNRYTFKIVYAKGEFPGNVFNDEFQMGVVDYISPPHLLSFEKSKKEGATWFWAEHLNREDIQYQVAKNLPEKYGIGPVEPKGNADVSVYVRASLVAFVFLLLTHFLVQLGNHEKILLNQDFYFSDTSGKQSYLIDDIELKKWKSNIELEINAPVDNSWFELQASLVNKESGDEYTIEQGLEYYSGVSEGEAWVEGSKSERVFFSSLPRGQYLLKLTALKDVSANRPWGVNLDVFSIRLTNDVPLIRNFWIVLVLVLIWPIYKFYITNKTEKARWENSAFSKFK